MTSVLPVGLTTQATDKLAESPHAFTFKVILHKNCHIQEFTTNLQVLFLVTILSVN